MRLTCLLLVIAFFLGNANAQAPLTLTEALEIAVERSPELQFYEADETAAEANLGVAKSLSRPTLSVFSRSATGDSGLTDSAIENQVGLRASVRIYDFGDARRARQSAELGLASQELRFVETRHQLGFNMLAVWLEGERARDRKAILEKRIEFLETLLTASENALLSGGILQSDLFEIQSRVSDARANVIDNDFISKRAEVELRTYLGEGLSISRAELLSLTNAERVVAEVSANHDKTKIESAAITAKKLDVEQRRIELERQQRTRLPVLELVGIASYSRGADQQWQYRDRLGVDVSVPLLTGALISSQTSAKRSDLMTAQAEVRELVLEQQENVEVSLERTLSLVAQLARMESARDEKEKHFRAVTQEFEAGFKVLPEYVEDRLDFERVELSYLDLKYDLAMEVVRLRVFQNRLFEAQSSIQE